MKVIAGDVERVHLVVGHLDAFRVLVGVDLAADLRPVLVVVAPMSWTMT